MTVQYNTLNPGNRLFWENIVFNLDIKQLSIGIQKNNEAIFEGTQCSDFKILIMWQVHNV